MASKKRVLWVELLRIVACISVVLVHTASLHFRDIPVDSYEWAVSNFYHGFPRFTVPCFIMISGALYLDKKRKWDLKRLYLKSILPIVAAYFFWQTFYAIYRGINGGVDIFSLEFIKFVLVRVSTSYFHLWYLPMLIGLLIITPLLWEIVNSERGKQLEEYMLIIFLIFKITTSMIGYLPLPYGDHINNLLTTVQPEIVTGYSCYYILGHYLYHYTFPKKMENIIYALGVVSIISGLLLCHYFSIQTGNEVQSFYGNYSYGGFFWSAATFLFFKNYVSRIQFKEKTADWICKLSSCTFGIYLVHAVFRDILNRHGIDSMIFNPLFAIPVVTMVVITISYVVVLIIKKIPVLGKWIV